METNVVYECKSDDMIDHIQKDIPIKTKFIPKGTIYYERREGGLSIYVIEQTPRTTRIKYRAKRAGETKSEIFRVAMPFLYFAILAVDATEARIKAVFPFCSKKPIRDFKDPIYVAPVTNIHETGNGAMCTGSIEGMAGRVPIFALVEKAMEAIYDSEWNDDVTTNFPPELKDFKSWDKLSMENPLIWSTANYTQHARKNLDGMVDFVLKLR